MERRLCHALHHPDILCEFGPIFWNTHYKSVSSCVFFQGISQCLITARLGFVNDGYELKESNHAVVPLEADRRHGTNEITITVSRETVVDAEKGPIDF